MCNGGHLKFSYTCCRMVSSQNLKPNFPTTMFYSAGSVASCTTYYSITVFLALSVHYNVFPYFFFSILSISYSLNEHENLYILGRKRLLISTTGLWFHVLRGFKVSSQSNALFLLRKWQTLSVCVCSYPNSLLCSCLYWNRRTHQNTEHMIQTIARIWLHPLCSISVNKPYPSDDAHLLAINMFAKNDACIRDLFIHFPMQKEYLLRFQRCKAFPGSFEQCSPP